MVAEELCPTVEVVSNDGAREPGGVGWVVAGGDVFGSAVFQLADRQLDDGVGAVELVGFDRVEIVAVRDEAVMAPLGEQAGLGGVREAGAAHDESHDAAVLLQPAAALVGGFGDLGVAAEGVVDIDPHVIGDARDRGFHVGMVGDGDRP